MLPCHLGNLHFFCRNSNEPVKEQEDAMQRIKLMAAKYGLKFFVIGQPRKSAAKDKGKLVHISDAKGSESFGSDSSAFFILHRDLVKNIDPANPPDDVYETKTAIHSGKGRTKGFGKAVAYLLFQGALARFEEMTFQEPPEGE